MLDAAALEYTLTSMKRCMWERFMPAGPQATLYQSRVFCSSNQPACVCQCNGLRFPLAYS
jgi:hypothetical protein